MEKSKKFEIRIILINYLFFSILLLYSACSKQNNSSNLGAERSIATTDSVHYACHFLIETKENYTKLTIINPWNRGKILKTYILAPKNRPLPDSLPDGILVRTPLSRAVSFGAVQCSFFEELDAIETLIGVCEPQYINIPAVAEGIAAGRIANIGAAANPDIEQLMSLQAEAIFASPLEEASSGRTVPAGAPIIECYDYMETSPLGRAEWLRFYALFFERREEADSLFAETKKRYAATVEACAHFEHRPTVFTETVYSGVWWLAGGNSYIAQLLRDAGADYLWRDNSNTGSIGLAFETVLERAENADFWLIKYNSPYELTLKQLAAENPNYSLFDAWKKGSVFGCNTGQTTYYEDLPLHPDRILRDFAAIFHPEAVRAYEMKYFKRLQ
jgi:iron complex transport system substrate-binding protein